MKAEVVLAVGETWELEFGAVTVTIYPPGAQFVQLAMRGDVVCLTGLQRGLAWLGLVAGDVPDADFVTRWVSVEVTE